MPWTNTELRMRWLCYAVVTTLQSSMQLTLDDGLVAWSGLHFEGPVLHILLHHPLAEVAPDESLGIKHGVAWVHGDLILGSIACSQHGNAARAAAECQVSTLQCNTLITYSVYAHSQLFVDTNQ